jgi:hypothetical protein
MTKPIAVYENFKLANLLVDPLANAVHAQDKQASMEKPENAQNIFVA